MCTDRDFSEDDLNKQLKQFWETETIGIAEVAESVEVANTPFLDPVKLIQGKASMRYTCHGSPVGDHYPRITTCVW